MNIKYNRWVSVEIGRERSHPATAQGDAAEIPVCLFQACQTHGLSFLPCSWAGCRAHGQEWSELSTATLLTGTGTAIKQSHSHDTEQLLGFKIQVTIPRSIKQELILLLSHIYSKVLLCGSRHLSGSEATAGIMIYYCIYFQSNTSSYWSLWI